MNADTTPLTDPTADPSRGPGMILVPPVRRPPRRRLTGLSELLERRADLRGAYAPADYMAEAFRWSA